MPTPAIHRPALPATLCREIGRIISRWAYLENFVQRTVWMLIGIGREEGRIAVREPPLTARLEMIADLTHLYRLKVDEKKLKRMNAAIVKNVEFRNAIAHGAWSFSHEHGLWQVTITKGSWDDQTLAKTERKKRVNPEGLLVNMDALQRTVGEIDDIINEATKLHEALEGQIAAWREKPPSPSDQLAHTRARRQT